MLALAAFACWAVPALSFDFAPIAQDFEPSGREATQNFRLENTSPKPIAVQLSVYSVDMTPDGREVRTAADSQFIVYPPQIVLLPQRTQMVRVQWIGPPKPEKELIYRLVAEQLPVDMQDRREEGAARLNILLKYEALLYVVPPGAKGALKLVSVGPATDAQGKAQLAITLENSGTAHGRVLEPKLQLTAASGAVATLGAEELEGLAGYSVLAGKTRRFLLPWPQAIPVGPVTADLSFDVGR